MYPEELEKYLEIQQISQNLSKTISDHYHIKETQIRWQNVTDFFKDTKKITISPLNKNQFNKLINSSYGIYGLTIINKYLSIVYYNDTSIPSRQHFTILHELSHIQLHSNTMNETYSSLITSNDYSDDDQVKEQEANILASQLIINDNALCQYINNGFTFNQICKEFEISREALKNRIKNHLKYYHIKNNIDHCDENKMIKNPFSYAIIITTRYIDGYKININPF